MSEQKIQEIRQTVRAIDSKLTKLGKKGVAIVCAAALAGSFIGALIVKFI